MAKSVAEVEKKIFKRHMRDYSREAYEENRDRKGYVDDGQIVDSTPMEPPIGYKKQPSMVDIVREQIRRHASELADEHGFETFEEADDFDIGDPGDLPRSKYEMEENFEPVVKPGKAKPVAKPSEKSAERDSESGEKGKDSEPGKVPSAGETPPLAGGKVTD